MNIVAAAVVLLALAQSSDQSALVEASKDGKAKRKTSTTKVITNADVARSKGKVSQRPGVAVTVKAPQTTMEKYEADRKARLIKEEKLKTLDGQIALLQKELLRLEQSYFEENDFSYRDGEIVKRFAETTAKLDALRRERDAIDPPPAP